MSASNIKPEDHHAAGRRRDGCKGTQLWPFLEDLGLEQLYKDKLSLDKLLQIDRRSLSDEPARIKSDVPWHVLKKLMMVNVTARNVETESETMNDVQSENSEFEFDSLTDSLKTNDMVNPLDVITALFLCSDGFVQQELALKMSTCQFSLPLLLSNCDTGHCTLLVWAMRDIVKKYRPGYLSQSEGFIEERIVHSEIPMISFVRVGDCALSKSETLNEILSNSQQYHDTFLHRDMACGDCPRKISSGLTEIAWYLPCGKKNIDVFSEPVAVANLRGDAASLETQFSFLCLTSAAVFVFFDNFEAAYDLLANKNHKAQIFLVGDQRSPSFQVAALKAGATKLGLTKSIIIKTKGQNHDVFIRQLRTKVNTVIENTKIKMPIEQMTQIAYNLGISVDEDMPECQSGKKNADAITSKIKTPPDYKATQLPLQGKIWKELTRIEKEEVRLKEVSPKGIEHYIDGLKQQKKELRRQQSSHNISDAMMCFINAISQPGLERCYFLKWMRMNLDNISRKKITKLRSQYKEKSGNKDEIKAIDQELSDSSLGIEHFFREMAQIYEASLSLPKTDYSRQQLQHLPKICADLLLEGLPLEIVDGEASNIPLRWVSDVLSQLDQKVAPKNKIAVTTVLGVQSTGKSTLLNTMFGVQFAVSSGRCTRGAFMLLIRMAEDVKEVFDYDFVVIVDTEGLKSPELAKLDDSHEHDNELATLVIGLSDITIINIAMENSVEMKDILQIVVHAFLRMKEVGKKPKCQFVYQNVSDVSAKENNLRGRTVFLDQLNEMTKAAAKMEKKEENKCFTDVMGYSPDSGNCYIPGLWNGNPPMAPINAGYSEAVCQLKREICKQLNESLINDISSFKEWMSSLWTAVKHENFIFSFRNSLVADAYMMLNTKYNNWEWDFKESIYKWVQDAETEISNFNMSARDVGECVVKLNTKALTKLCEGENVLLEELQSYFQCKEGHVHLIESYKQTFVKAAESVRKEMEAYAKGHLSEAAELKQGKTKIEKIMDDYTKEIEKAVSALIDKCRETRVEMGDDELDQEFDKMWAEKLDKLHFPQQTAINVFSNAKLFLKQNMSQKGSYASELLSKNKLEDCGNTQFKFKAKVGEQALQLCSKIFPCQDPIVMTQNLADRIIADCVMYIEDMVNTKHRKHEKDGSKVKNYSDAFIQEILRMIDMRLQSNQDFKPDIQFEVYLKQHICGVAAREFQKMHKDFLRENDPHRKLQSYKPKFLEDFKDVFNNRDQCQKKAEEFTQRCLKPAVENFVYTKLGLDIVRVMRNQKGFDTRMFTQCEILLDLLLKDKFEEYLSYICSYEIYVKDWILAQIQAHFKGSNISELEAPLLRSSVGDINDAIGKAEKKTSSDLKTFITHFCQELEAKLVISKEDISAFMILNKANQEQFARWFTKFVKEMEQDLKQEFSESAILYKLSRMDFRPQDELFSQLMGCGQQCPFCKAPCVVGAGGHNEHAVSLHRPEGLGGYRWKDSRKLCTDICSSLVNSEASFCCSATQDKYHPYKKYREIYPDWRIPPDGSFQALDYWKYVMARFNDSFAKKNNAQPAEIPPGWKNITLEEAKNSVLKSVKLM